MAEQKKDAPQAKQPAPALGAAGESADARVHHLLAEREIAVLNGDEDAVKVFTERLAELGVK